MALNWEKIMSKDSLFKCKPPDLPSTEKIRELRTASAVDIRNKVRSALSVLAGNLSTAVTGPLFLQDVQQSWMIELEQTASELRILTAAWALAEQRGKDEEYDDAEFVTLLEKELDRL